MKLAVAGATGRMGSSVIENIRAHDHHTLHTAISRASQEVDGYDIVASETGVERLPGADVLIDFTAPGATVNFAQACAIAGVPLVTGTTGLSPEQETAIDAVTDSIPVLSASNFSIGIHAMKRAIDSIGHELADYDVEVTETHHARKVDAPSGTALDLLETIRDDRAEVDPIHGRQGDAERSPAEVGVFARRGGDIRGVHEVLFAGNDEQLTLTHRVGSRRVFAHGAITAAEWVAEASPGRYAFEEVLA